MDEIGSHIQMVVYFAMYRFSNMKVSREEKNKQQS